MWSVAASDGRQLAVPLLGEALGRSSVTPSRTMLVFSPVKECRE